MIIIRIFIMHFMPRKMFAVFVAITIGFLALLAWSVAVIWNLIPGQQSSAGHRQESPVETVKVEAYFSNANLNPNIMDCSLVFPVVREVPKTQDLVRAALNETLAGPRWDEKNAGYDTAINSGVMIRSFSIENGVARADFNAQLGQEVGGSCRVGLIRSQITRTLMQFPAVNSVVLSVDGRVEDILQP
jgi:spore germination protein GerM